MRHLSIPAAALILCACGGPEGVEQTVLEGAPPVCEGGPRVPTITITHKVATTGSLPNVIRQIGVDELAVVESGNNGLSVLDSGQLERLVDLPTSRNPYDVTPFGETLWATNFLADSVAVIDRATGAFEELQSDQLDDPSGIARWGDRIYVTNVSYTAPNEPYGPGSVTVFDGASRAELRTVQTSAKNPIFARSFGTGDDSMLVISASGELFLDDGGAGVATPGAVEVWRDSGDDVDVSAFPLPLVDNPQVGAPGRPLMSPDGTLYFASGTAPILFELDPESGWIHGVDDPLVFGPLAGDSLHHAAMSERGVILVTSFNEDGLILWDTTCNQPMTDEPIDLGTTSLLEGPHGVEIAREEGETTEAYFIMNLSNVVGKIELNWGG